MAATKIAPDSAKAIGDTLNVVLSTSKHTLVWCTTSKTLQSRALECRMRSQFQCHVKRSRMCQRAIKSWREHDWLDHIVDPVLRTQVLPFHRRSINLGT